MEHRGLELELGACLTISPAHALQRAMQLQQQLFSGRPIDARVGDGHAINELAQVLGYGLAASLQMALEHETDNGAVAVHDLGDAILGDQRLQLGLLIRVAMAAVDHNRRRQARRGQFPFRHRNTDGIVIDAPAAAAQYDMRVLIAARTKYG